MQTSLKKEILKIQKLLNSDNEELILNSMACIANYTFFKNEENLLLKENYRLLKKVLDLMITDHEEITNQGIRILCNISNTMNGKEILISETRLISNLLQHHNREIVYYTACTILNISSIGKLEFLDSTLNVLVSKI